jgi:hypothetical protein
MEIGEGNEYFDVNLYIPLQLRWQGDNKVFIARYIHLYLHLK